MLQVSNKNPPTHNECVQWKKKPDINPRNGRKLNPNGRIYKIFNNSCNIDPPMFVGPQLYIDNLELGKTTKTAKYIFVLMLFLSKMFDKECFVYIPMESPKYNPKKKGFVWNIRDYFTGELSLHHTLDSIFKKCIKNKKKRFILIPMSLKRCDGTNKSAHANFIIVDKKKKTLERFEPKGTTKNHYNPSNLNKKLKEYSNRHGWKYISPSMICPNIHPQRIQERTEKPYHKSLGQTTGFCQAWSTWYAYLRMKYPDIPQHQLIETSVKQITEDKMYSLTQFIIDFAFFFVDVEPILNDPTKIEEIIKEFTNNQ